MKRILLGSPANTVSVATPNFICNSRCSDWGKEAVVWERLAECIYMKRSFGGRNRKRARVVCYLKGRVAPQWLTSPFSGSE